jgi:molybdenum cofactor cytidylyltransferase
MTSAFSHCSTNEPPVGILLAAGLGRRYDPTGQQSKLDVLLSSGKTVMESSAVSMRQALSRVVLIVRALDAEAERVAEIANCELLVCPDADRGMGFVLSFAVRNEFDALGWVIGLADMPYVACDTIKRISDEISAGHAVVAPIYQGRRGNPVGFGAIYRDRLLSLTGDRGARDLINTSGYIPVEVEDRGVLIDIDTVADLQV